MKLAQIELNGRPRLALAVDGEFIDLTAHLGVGVSELSRFLSMGSDAVNSAARLIASATPRLSMDSVRLRGPVPPTAKLLGVGMNYHSFVAAAERLGLALPRQLIWFLRPHGCVAGAHDDVWLPRNATDLDYEAELAVVIGRRCRYVSAAEAPAMIGGYLVANDLTLRQRIPKSLVHAKSFDTHTPLGPWIVTVDEIGDPQNLGIRTWVNGQLRQRSGTLDMVASCHELVAEISSACTLNPGDIILTGTPDGSGIFQHPPSALAAGDVVKIEIEGIGVIENRVVDEPAILS